MKARNRNKNITKNITKKTRKAGNVTRNSNRKNSRIKKTFQALKAILGIKKKAQKDAPLGVKWEAIRDDYNDFLLWLKDDKKHNYSSSAFFPNLRMELNRRFYPGPGDTFLGKMPARSPNNCE